MKIEKVNENQIRCTLTKEDLASRQLKISELAYGTDKAKSLFRDMMQQASFEFGFEADDIPLMIEAIPMNAECIVLVITKVEDPEELDTRFSRFAPSVHEADDMEQIDAEDSKDEVLDLFKKIQTADTADNTKADITAVAPSEAASGTEAAPKQLIRLFRFASMNAVIKLASHISCSYDGICTLYKDRQDSYLLLLSHSSEQAESFNKLCNIASEYAACLKVQSTTAAYLEEHCQVIIAQDALKILASIHS